MSAGLIAINVDLDIEAIVSKVWDKFLGIFGKDAASQELKDWLADHTRAGFLESRDVQCIGMHTPLLISEIYQPTRLVRNQAETIRAVEGSRSWNATEPEFILVDRFLVKAIIAFYDRYRGQHYYDRTEDKIECQVEEEFITNSSPKFLAYILQVCAPIRGKTTDTLAAYAIVELASRKIPLTQQTYALCKKNYKSDQFAFSILDRQSNLRMKDILHE